MVDSSIPYSGANPLIYSASHPNDVNLTFREDYKDMVLITGMENSQLLGHFDEVDMRGASVAYIYDLEVMPFDQLQEKYGNTPHKILEHNARQLVLESWEAGTLIDKHDAMFSATDPKSNYVRSFGYGIAQKMDEVLGASFFGTVATGRHGGGTPIVWGADKAKCKIIAHNSQSMTLGKILTAKRWLDNKKVPKWGRKIALSSDEVAMLFNTSGDKLSRDYVEGYVQKTGKLPVMYGFEFVECEDLPYDNAGAPKYRRCVAWQELGMKRSAGNLSDIRVDVLPDKRYATQIYGEVIIAARRAKEEYVVEIQCMVPSEEDLKRIV